MDGYGVVFINSSPMEAVIDSNAASFIMTSGMIDFFVLNGPRPKEIVMQLQKTVGNPILPPYSALNWNLNLISADPEQDLPEALKIFKKWSESDFKNPFDSIWFDHEGVMSSDKVKSLNSFVSDSGVEVFPVKRSPLLKEETETYEHALSKNLLINKAKDIPRPVEGKTNIGECVFLDYLNPGITEFIKSTEYNKRSDKFSISRILLTQNEPSHNFRGSLDREGNKFSLPYTPNSIDLIDKTLPVYAIQYGNNTLLDTHNLYALQQTKVYRTILRDSGVERPILFSRSSFPGFAQYSGKWLGYLPQNYEGLKYSIIQTMNFNVLIILLKDFRKSKRHS